MDAEARVLIYEDERKPVELLAAALARTGFPVSLWRSSAISSEPKPFAGKGEAWTDDEAVRFKKAAAIVVDITLVASACECEFCRTDNHGLHVLDQLERGDHLHKAFIASSQLARIRMKHSEFYERIQRYLTKGLSVFSDKSQPDELAQKIAAWARFDQLGYSADFETRERLYLVGQRGREVHPEHVLILGPSGTGKQDAAQFVHDVGHGGGRERRFAPILCGGLLDRGLAKSQLFGHVRGAYSDAITHEAGKLISALGWKPPAGWPYDSRRPASDDFANWLLAGRFGGRQLPLFEHDQGDLRIGPDAPDATIFLDEFQDLDTAVQALLMRVVDQGEMEPMGFNGRILLRDSTGRLHLRFMGATNSEAVRIQLELLDKDQARAVPRARRSDESSVRQDLVSRLSAWLIELKEVRPDEAAFLIEKELGQRKSAMRWSDEAVEALQSLIDQKHFVGNRRQVRQLILRATALAEYEKSSGRVLAPAATVLGRHVQTAAKPITPTAHPSPATNEMALFLARTIDVTVEQVSQLASPGKTALTKKQFDDLLKTLETSMRKVFLAEKTRLERHEVEAALRDAAPHIVDRLRGIKWATKAMLINPTKRLVPAVTRMLLKSADEASLVPTGAANRR